MVRGSEDRKVYIFTPNTLIKSSEINANFTDAIDITKQTSNPYKFYVYKDANATATSGAYTRVNFNVEDFDTNSNFDNTTNFCYTIPINGYYLFKSVIGVTSGATAGRGGLTFYIDGAIAEWGDLRYMGGSNNWRCNGTIFDYFTAGQTIDVRFYCDGSNATILGTREQCHFSGVLITI